jgi:outer membrane protein assembly factor BamB
MASGWSGGVISDGTLFIGSMDGNLVALDVVDGSQLGEPVMLEAEAPSGGLGCLPTCGTAATQAVPIYSSPDVNGDLVYVGGYDGKVRAFKFDVDRLRQEPRWIYPRQGDIGGRIVGGLVTAQGKVFFGSSNGKVYALEVTDGFKEWIVDIGDKIWSTPAIDGNTLFIGCFDKKLYALSTADGTEKWQFETEGAIVSTPVVYNGIVYFGSFDRHIYAVNAISGNLVWQFPEAEEEGTIPENWFWAKPVVHNGAVYAACLDGRVYVLDAANGRRLAGFDLESAISSSPALVGDLLIVATQDGIVYSLDTTNKQEKQLTTLEEKVNAPLFASEDTVYIHTVEDSLYALNPLSGARQKFELSTE